ncbi:MAG: 4Fe-4S dicluster domain-containing protein [Planctomycetes bacterium]|nr:4Fe-4S dicluster domain-containing protein [Planctomycetota bacterium]
MCTLSPKLVECARNKNIDIITLADVEGISGEPGNFQVAISRRPRYVEARKCNTCGDCVEACPVSLPNEFDRAIGTRKAIFRPYPQAIPNLYGISKAGSPAPCKAACPAGVNAQGYVALIAQGEFKEAYDLIFERCPLPAVCGRVCQHPCQSECNRKDIDEGVSVRDLKRFAADYVYAHRDEFKGAPAAPAEQQKEKVAVIGGGPAGLTAAVDLRRMGYAVTVFEARPLMGGMLRYGIPRYRLAAEVLDQEIKNILDLGIEARTGSRVEKSETLLKPKTNGGSAGGEKFDAVFVAIGAWTTKKLGIPGEDAPQVLPGLKFLHDVNVGGKPAIGPNVLVIGGGDVAVDAARCARRLSGVKAVRLASLEKPGEMPAHSSEAAEALEEGVEFHNGWGPTKVLTDGGTVTGVEFRACTRVFDENRCFSPQFDDAKTTTVRADTVIVTIGQGIDTSTLGTVTTGPGGRVAADKETLATSIAGIFAGGDVVRPSDNQHPKSIALVQCVGSRDTARNAGYCSSICCMSATKEAMVALEHAPGAEISIFCMDIRAFGKEFDQYVNRARDEHKVKYIRAMPSRLVEIPGSKNLRVRYFDENGEEQQKEFDLVVLSVGLRPSAGVRETAERLGLALNEFGFCRTDRLAPVATSRPGIYVAGAFQEPKDIPESVAQASGAAACAMEQLASVRGNLIQRRDYPWERDVTDEDPRRCVACATCVKVCPYGAPMINDLQKAEIQGAKCMGCGSCVAVCPRRAITLRHQEDAQVLAMLDELLVADGGL